MPKNLPQTIKWGKVHPPLECCFTEFLELEKQNLQDIYKIFLGKRFYSNVLPIFLINTLEEQKAILQMPLPKPQKKTKSYYLMKQIPFSQTEIMRLETGNEPKSTSF